MEQKVAISQIGLILLSVATTAAAQILLKVGMSSPATQKTLAGGLTLGRGLSILISPWVFFGLVLYGVAALLWLGVLSKTPISFAYPFVALGFVLTALAGHFLFGENLTATRIVSIIVIFSGVILLAKS